MPTYNLLLRDTNNPGSWNNTGYQLHVSGSGNGQGNLHVKYRNGNSGQWNDLSGATRNGSGTPDSPQNGDTLGLPSSIPGVSTSIVGRSGMRRTAMAMKQAPSM